MIVARMFGLWLALLSTSNSVAATTNAAPVFQAERIQSDTFQSEIYTVHLGQRSKPMVLLIHGLGQAGWTDWQQVMPALSEHYFVLTFDLPGFGKSAASNVLYSPEQYARLCEEIRQRFAPGKKIHVIGHSLGGAVALQYAAQYARQIEKLVLVDVAGIVHRSVFMQHVMRASLRPDNALLGGVYQWLEPGLSRFGAGLTRRLEQLPDFSRFLLENPLAREQLLHERSNLQAALALIETNFIDTFSKADMPTLIVWGEHDPVTSLRTGKLLKKKMPNASLQTLSGAGHVPMKSHFAAFITTVKPFLLQPPTPTQQASSFDPLPLVRCHKQRGFYFSGKATRIELESCPDARLEQVETTALQIMNSEADVFDLRIRSTQTAIVLQRSRLTLTAADISAPLGFQAEDSVLDVAGLELHGASTLWQGSGSNGFFSVSRRWRGDGSSESLHDVFHLR